MPRRFFRWKTPIGRKHFIRLVVRLHPAPSAREIDGNLQKSESIPLEKSPNLSEPTVSHYHLDVMARGVHSEVGCHGRLYPPASGFLHPVTSHCMSSATSLPSPIKQLNEAPPQDSRISHSVYFFPRSSSTTTTTTTTTILLAPASLLQLVDLQAGQTSYLVV